MEIAIGIILIITAIFLVIAVLMQQGKNHNLSGAIAGGAETFFGKSKASTLDKKLSKLTTVVAIVFTLVVLVSYLMQDTTNLSGYDPNGVVNITTTQTGTETSAAENNETVAAETTGETTGEAETTAEAAE